LHNVARIERSIGSTREKTIDLANKENISTIEVQIGDDGIELEPGETMLASSNEIFDLPDWLAAEYKLKSSMARNFLEHLNAGWCDPGWQGSRLTLELKNMNMYHTLILRPGMKIGQIVFFACEPVPKDKSYSVTGRYNNQAKVTEAKGVE
jgi:deoxycytidine triphosphate deaminase